MESCRLPPTNKLCSQYETTPPVTVGGLTVVSQTCRQDSRNIVSLFQTSCCSELPQLLRFSPVRREWSSPGIHDAFFSLFSLHLLVSFNKRKTNPRCYLCGDPIYVGIKGTAGEKEWDLEWGCRRCSLPCGPCKWDTTATYRPLHPPVRQCNGVLRLIAAQDCSPMTDWALFIKGISICNFSTPQGTNTNLQSFHGEEYGCSHRVE